MRHHTCSHRVQLNIPIMGEHIAFLLGNARFETPLPKWSASPVALDYVLSNPLSMMLHHERGRILFCWYEQQMNMISDQTIDIDRAAKSPSMKR